jgi:hypothetical protein
MHSRGFDFERNHGPNRRIDSFRQRGHHKSQNMISAALRPGVCAPVGRVSGVPYQKFCTGFAC